MMYGVGQVISRIVNRWPPLQTMSKRPFVEFLQLADVGSGADTEWLHGCFSDFVALADQVDAERLVAFDAAVDHELVTLFEDVQRQAATGEKHSIQREDGQLHGPASPWRRSRAVLRKLAQDCLAESLHR